MKKLILSIAIFTFILNYSFSQNEQESSKFLHSLRINPIDFGRSEFQLLYELKHNNNKNSFVFMPSIILKENPNDSASGFQTMAQYRFYLTNFNKNDRHTFLNVYNYGFYTGVYGLYLNFSEEFTQGFYNPTSGDYENKEYNREVEAGEGGAFLGIRIDITKRIVLDFYLGGGIRKSKVLDTSIVDQEYIYAYSVFDREYTGVKPKSGLSLGITF